MSVAQAIMADLFKIMSSGQWLRPAEICDLLPSFNRASVREAISALEDEGVVERRGDRRSPSNEVRLIDTASRGTAS